MAFYNVKMAIKRQIEILESFKSTFCRDCYATLDNIWFTAKCLKAIFDTWFLFALRSWKIKVWVIENLTRDSSNTLLPLVKFSATQTLQSENKHPVLSKDLFYFFSCWKFGDKILASTFRRIFLICQIWIVK